MLPRYRTISGYEIAPVVGFVNPDFEPKLDRNEVESAFVAHPKVAEAAVVGYPHDIKGNGLYCYVTLNSGEKPSGEIEKA